MKTDIKTHNELVNLLVALQQPDVKVVSQGKEINLSQKTKWHLTHLIQDGK